MMIIDRCRVDDYLAKARLHTSYTMRICLFAIFIFLLPSITFAQGLLFQGYGILMENRSSYSVFNDNAPQFEDELTIRFSISFHDIDKFGYIFLLKDGNSDVEYNLIYSYRHGQSSSLKFNTEGKDNLISIDLDNSILNNRTWIDFSCTLFLNSDSIRMSINNEEFSVKDSHLPRLFKGQLYFGKNKNSVDIPSYSIRNLSVEGNKQKYYFPLNESTGNDVHDSNGKIIGQITNPTWLINSYYYWKQRYTYKSINVSAVNYQYSTQNMIFLNKDSISEFNLKSGLHSVRNYKNNFPLNNMRLGMTFFDGDDNLYGYEVCDYTLLKTDTTVTYLDIQTDRWTPLRPQALPVQLHHHSGYFDIANKRHIIFGGFGNQKYSNVFYVYDLVNNKWNVLELNGDKISPRFFQGMAKVPNNNQLLIFGGMGNKTGDQTVGRHNFYDLHQIDLDTKEVKKLWDLKWSEKNIVPCRNMVMLDSSSFYVLCYPEYEPNSYLQLYRFSVKNGNYEILGDSIPFRSDKIATNANLYYNTNLQEFYCTVQEFEDDGSSIVHVHSLSAPAVDKKALTIYLEKEKSKASLYWLLLLIPIGFLLALLFRCIYKKKTTPLFLKPQTASPPINLEKEDKPNSIYIFGEFAVYDKKGKDISYMFSPRIKDVLILILQYSFKNGISTQKLSESFWPDKSGSSLKNVRGVTLNHLRKLILELDGIELLFEKGYFKILISEHCYCDYAQFMLLTDKTSVLENSGKFKDINNILVRGKFLKSFDTYLFDSFKTKVDSTIVSILPVDIEIAFKQEDFYLVIKLSELLFITDPLNEEALYYQTRALTKLKQRDEAKKKYALFSAEYKKVMGENYNTSLETIIKEKRY